MWQTRWLIVPEIESCDVHSISPFEKMCLSLLLIMEQKKWETLLMCECVQRREIQTCIFMKPAINHANTLNGFNLSSFTNAFWLLPFDDFYFYNASRVWFRIVFSLLKLLLNLLLRFASDGIAELNFCHLLYHKQFAFCSSWETVVSLLVWTEKRGV